MEDNRYFTICPKCGTRIYDYKTVDKSDNVFLFTHSCKCGNIFSNRLTVGDRPPDIDFSEFLKPGKLAEIAEKIQEEIARKKSDEFVKKSRVR